MFLNQHHPFREQSIILCLLNWLELWKGNWGWCFELANLTSIPNPLLSFLSPLQRLKSEIPTFSASWALGSGHIQAQMFWVVAGKLWLRERKDLFRCFPFLLPLALNIYVMSGAVAATLYSWRRARGNCGDPSPDIIRPLKWHQQPPSLTSCNVEKINLPALFLIKVGWVFCYFQLKGT